jgi:hypothetical protein
MFTTFSRRVASETPVNPAFLAHPPLVSNGVSIMRIVFALAIGIITVGLSTPAAHANWRHHHYYWSQQRFHPDNIYLSHCRGGWVNCGRDSAKHHEDANPQQR